MCSKASFTVTVLSAPCLKTGCRSKGTFYCVFVFISVHFNSTLLFSLLITVCPAQMYCACVSLPPPPAAAQLTGNSSLSQDCILKPFPANTPRQPSSFHISLGEQRPQQSGPVTLPPLTVNLFTSTLSKAFDHSTPGPDATGISWVYVTGNVQSLTTSFVSKLWIECHFPT